MMPYGAAPPSFYPGTMFAHPGAQPVRLALASESRVGLKGEHHFRELPIDLRQLSVDFRQLLVVVDRKRA